MRTKTFCVLPWIHAATLPDGNVQLCCVSGGGSGVNLNEGTLADFWNSEHVKDARRRMLAGQPVKACRDCYSEEAHGHQSHRVVVNDVWKRRLGEDALDKLFDRTGADGTLDASLQYLDLRLGNTCNMQCVMCQSRESSRWLPAARELAKLSQDDELKREFEYQAALDVSRFDWCRDPRFWASLTPVLPRVREILIGGGEPFLIKEQFAFVKSCCEQGEAHHIRLHYHTNGTMFPEEMTPYWNQFERVHFFVSLDGVGDVANYVRFPTNWQLIEDNIRRLDSIGGNTFTNFHFTTHALNVFQIPDLYDWAESRGLRSRQHFANMQEYVCTGLVHEPAYQDIRVLPADYKRMVTERLNDYMSTRLAGQATDNLAGILTFMNSDDRSRLMSTLAEYTRLLDLTRRTNRLETFPELAPYWSRYESDRLPLAPAL